MNRKEFQEWLNQFDEETIIEIVYHTDGHGYYDQGGNATTTEFTPNSGFYDNSWCQNGHFEYSDFTNNQYVKEGHPYYGKKLLLIGGIRQ